MEYSARDWVLKALRSHEITHYERHGRIIALDCWTQNGEYGETEIDVTDYKPKQLMLWLGY